MKSTFWQRARQKENLIKGLKYTPLEPINNHQGIRKGKTTKIVCKVKILGREKESDPNSSQISRLVSGIYFISF